MTHSCNHKPNCAQPSVTEYAPGKRACFMCLPTVSGREKAGAAVSYSETKNMLFARARG